MKFFPTLSIIVAAFISSAGAIDDPPSFTSSSSSSYSSSYAGGKMNARVGYVYVAARGDVAIQTVEMNSKAKHVIKEMDTHDFKEDKEVNDKEDTFSVISRAKVGVGVGGERKLCFDEDIMTSCHSVIAAKSGYIHCEIAASLRDNASYLGIDMMLLYVAPTHLKDNQDQEDTTTATDATNLLSMEEDGANQSKEKLFVEDTPLDIDLLESASASAYAYTHAFNANQKQDPSDAQSTNICFIDTVYNMSTFTGHRVDRFGTSSFDSSLMEDGHHDHGHDARTHTTGAQVSSLCVLMLIGAHESPSLEKKLGSFTPPTSIPTKLPLSPIPTFSSLLFSSTSSTPHSHSHHPCPCCCCAARCGGNSRSSHDDESQYSPGYLIAEGGCAYASLDNVYWYSYWGIITAAGASSDLKDLFHFASESSTANSPNWQHLNSLVHAFDEPQREKQCDPFNYSCMCCLISSCNEYRCAYRGGLLFAVESNYTSAALSPSPPHPSASGISRKCIDEIVGSGCAAYVIENAGESYSFGINYDEDTSGDVSLRVVIGIALSIIGSSLAMPILFHWAAGILIAIIHKKKTLRHEQRRFFKVYLGCLYHLLPFMIPLLWPLTAIVVNVASFRWFLKLKSMETRLHKKAIHWGGHQQHNVSTFTDNEKGAVEDQCSSLCKMVYLLRMNARDLLDIGAIYYFYQRSNDFWDSTLLKALFIWLVYKEMTSFSESSAMKIEDDGNHAFQSSLIQALVFLIVTTIRVSLYIFCCVSVTLKLMSKILLSVLTFATTILVVCIGKAISLALSRRMSIVSFVILVLFLALHRNAVEAMEVDDMDMGVDIHLEDVDIYLDDDFFEGTGFGFGADLVFNQAQEGVFESVLQFCLDIAVMLFNKNELFVPSESCIFGDCIEKDKLPTLGDSNNSKIYQFLNKVGSTYAGMVRDNFYDESKTGVIRTIFDLDLQDFTEHKRLVKKAVEFCHKFCAVVTPEGLLSMTIESALQLESRGIPFCLVLFLHSIANNVEQSTIGGGMATRGFLRRLLLNLVESGVQMLFPKLGINLSAESMPHEWLRCGGFMKWVGKSHYECAECVDSFVEKLEKDFGHLDATSDHRVSKADEDLTYFQYVLRKAVEMSALSSWALDVTCLQLTPVLMDLIFTSWSDSFGDINPFRHGSGEDVYDVSGFSDEDRDYAYNNFLRFLTRLEEKLAGFGGLDHNFEILRSALAEDKSLDQILTERGWKPFMNLNHGVFSLNIQIYSYQSGEGCWPSFVLVHGPPCYAFSTKSNTLQEWQITHMQKRATELHFLFLMSRKFLQPKMCQGYQRISRALADFTVLNNILMAHAMFIYLAHNFHCGTKFACLFSKNMLVKFNAFKKEHEGIRNGLYGEYSSRGIVSGRAIRSKWMQFSDTSYTQKILNMISRCMPHTPITESVENLDILSVEQCIAGIKAILICDNSRFAAFAGKKLVKGKLMEKIAHSFEALRGNEESEKALTANSRSGITTSSAGGSYAHPNTPVFTLPSNVGKDAKMLDINVCTPNVILTSVASSLATTSSGGIGSGALRQGGINGNSLSHGSSSPSHEMIFEPVNRNPPLRGTRSNKEEVMLHTPCSGKNKNEDNTSKKDTSHIATASIVSSSRVCAVMCYFFETEGLANCPWGEKGNYAYDKHQLKFNYSTLTCLTLSMESSEQITDALTHLSRPCMMWTSTEERPFGRRYPAIHDPFIIGSVENPSSSLSAVFVIVDPLAAAAHKENPLIAHSIWNIIPPNQALGKDDTFLCIQLLNLGSENTKLREKVKSAEECNQTLKSNYEAKISRMRSDSAAQVLALQNSVDDLLTQVKQRTLERDGAMEDLEDYRVENEFRISRLQLHVEVLRHNIDTTKESTQALMRDDDSLHTQFNELRLENTKLASRVASAEESNRNLTEVNAALRTEIDHLGSENTELRQKIESLQLQKLDGLGPKAAPVVTPAPQPQGRQGSAAAVSVFTEAKLPAVSDQLR